MSNETKMTRREAHKRGSMKFYNRHRSVEWLNDYGYSRVSWLIEHKHLKVSAARPELRENRSDTFFEFTRKGKWWHDWYSMSFREILKYKVFPFWLLRPYWQRFMIKVFHKHYAWQDYVGIEPRDI